MDDGIKIAQSLNYIANHNVGEWLKLFRSNIDVCEKYFEAGKYDAAVAIGLEAVGIYNNLLFFLKEENILNKNDLKIVKNRFAGKQDIGNANLKDLKNIKRLSEILGNSYKNKAEEKYIEKNYQQALAYSKQAYLLNPKDALVNYTMGKILMALKANKEAADSYEKVMLYDKNYTEGRRILAELYSSKDAIDIDKSIFNCLEYLKKENGTKQMYLGLAAQYSWLGMHNECEKACLEAIKIEAGNENAAIIYMLNFLKMQNKSQQEIKETTEKIVENYLMTKEIKKRIYNFKNRDLEKNKKLKIGYLSSDFYAHVVSKFLLPVIENHNKNNVEIHLYSVIKKPDNVTEIYIKNTDFYTDCSKMSLKEIADKIYEDKIDILVDLNIFTGNSRIFTLALKPAPVQCIYLGYPNTSGLDTIDYILTDRNTIKPEEAEFYTEKLAYIEEGYEVYKKDTKTIPETTIPPYLSNKYITMGVFNSTSKITVEMIDLWASILKQSKNTKIMFQYMKYYTKNNIERILKEFERNSISKDRIIFDEKDEKTHYNNIKKADFALDTHPYSGTGTTIDTLLMGVPIVCFEGFNSTSRPTSRILKCIKEAELIAKTKEEYIEIALRLINNSKMLLSYRENLRSKLKTSKLTSYKAFCTSLEETYKKIWGDYVESINASLSASKAPIIE